MTAAKIHAALEKMQEKLESFALEDENYASDFNSFKSEVAILLDEMMEIAEKSEQETENPTHSDETPEE